VICQIFNHKHLDVGGLPIKHVDKVKELNKNKKWGYEEAEHPGCKIFFWSIIIHT